MSDSIKIATTQNVDIEFQPASAAERLLSGLIDLMVYAIYILMFFLISDWLNFRPGYLVSFLILLPLSFYSIVMELLFNGQTLGKMILKTRVIKLDGSPAAIGDSLMRWLFRLADIWFSVTIPGTVGLVTILFNQKGQRLGDIAAGTSVIRLKQKITLKDITINKFAADYRVTYHEAALLTDRDAELIRTVFFKAIKRRQFEIIDELSFKVQRLLNITSEYDSIRFLKILISDFEFIVVNTDQYNSHLKI